MSEAKHTPEQWRWKNPRYLVNASDSPIMACHLDWMPSISDARLIAAAPELLAACEAVEWGGTRVFISGDTTDQCPCCWKALYEGHAPNCQLAAAIKAAKGE